MPGYKSALDALVFFLLAVLLIVAPLVKGGNRPLPLMALELMSLPLLVFVVWRPAFLRHLDKGFLLALGLLVVYALLQWLPLVPVTVWDSLAGRAVYATALAEFGEAAKMLRSLSIVPGATEAAWLAMLPPIAVLLTAVGLRDRDLTQLVYVFLGMAAFQAVLGLIQFGGGTQTAFRMTPADIGMATGTYANRNHLAGLLEMALPIALGLLASRFGRGERDLSYAGRNRLWRLVQLLARLPRPNQTMLFAALFILLLLGLIFSRSRTGIILGMLGILLSAALFARHIGGVRSNSLATVLAVIGLALAAVIGLAPVLARFSVDDALTDARWTIYSTSMKAAWTFFPFGSGLGTFPEVYWRFQPDSISQFVNHVHNDYLELVFEAGLPALVAMVLFLVLYVLRWPRLLRHNSWDTLGFMKVGSGISLLLMALHGFTDFNLHIPANAIYFAFLVAVFFHHGEHRMHSHAAEPAKSKMPADIQGEPVQPLSSPQVRGKNPFAD